MVKRANKNKDKLQLTFLGEKFEILKSQYTNSQKKSA